MALAKFQVFNRHVWLEATMLDSTDIEHFRKFYWTVLLSMTLKAEKVDKGIWNRVQGCITPYSCERAR